MIASQSGMTDVIVHSQAALQIHIRFLSQLCGPYDTPPKITVNLSTLLMARSMDHTSIQSPVDAAISRARDMPRAVEVLLDKLQHLINHAGANFPHSKIYRDLTCMLQSHREHIPFTYSALISVGLSNWTPDVYCKNPLTPYNLLHERVALLTFETMCTLFAYTMFSVDLGYLKQPALLQQVCDIILFTARACSETVDSCTGTACSLIFAGLARRSVVV